MRNRHGKIIRTAVVALAAAGFLALPAQGEMRSVEISRHLCETTGGGKFVDIPGFPGEKIDRRLLRDIRWMKRRYKIFITDGYAMSGHAPNGEHPIGLALDIVPNRAAGGGWNYIDRLANLAEPQQNQPRPPWRWVGYNGDSGHGRGHHLHLSYMHSPTDPGDPARKVWTRHCPDQPDGGGDGGGGDSGGISAQKTSSSGGGLSARDWELMAPVVPETE
jgi:hypothetical protein